MLKYEWHLYYGNPIFIKKLKNEIVKEKVEMIIHIN